MLYLDTLIHQLLIIQGAFMPLIDDTELLFAGSQTLREQDTSVNDYTTGFLTLH